MNKTKLMIILGGISGFLSIALGAFASHGLKESISSEMFDIFKTGVLYQLIHSIVILVIGISNKLSFFNAALFLLLGIILFSFSLYAYSLTQLKFFALITPIGGISFLTGWGLIIFEGIKMKKNN